MVEEAGADAVAAGGRFDEEPGDERDGLVPDHRDGEAHHGHRGLVVEGDVAHDGVVAHRDPGRPRLRTGEEPDEVPIREVDRIAVHVTDPSREGRELVQIADLSRPHLHDTESGGGSGR